MTKETYKSRAALAEGLATMTETRNREREQNRVNVADLTRKIESRDTMIKDLRDEANTLRDTILRHVTENARLRGYLDRIEDETPQPRPMRYGIDQQRRASMGRGDDFAMMGMEPTRRGPREWHHR